MATIKPDGTISTEYVSEQKQIVETDAKGAPVKDVLWNAHQIQTDAVQIRDPGVGRGVILRHFFFKAEPLPKGTKRPTKLDILNHFKRLIEMTLWGDGLIVRYDKPLEVHTRQGVKKISRTLFAEMKRIGADFIILVLCEARKNQTIAETPLIAK